MRRIELGIEAAGYPNFIDLAGLLPGVDAVAALDAFRSEYRAVLAGEDIEERLVRAGVTLLSFQEPLHDIERDGEVVFTVSPAGARLLLSLHEAQWFPRVRCGGWAPAPAEFIDYAEGNPSVVGLLLSRERERAAHDRRLNDLSAWGESDLAFELLNALFSRHFGRGEGTLVIGGIPVTRSIPVPGLIPHANHYAWVGSDRLRHHVTHVRSDVGPA